MKQPATPLPWEVDDEAVVCGGNFVVAYPPEASTADDADQNAAYIAHAANAYPKLVEALREFSAVLPVGRTNEDRQASACALLRELGEE